MDYSPHARRSARLNEQTLPDPRGLPLDPFASDWTGGVTKAARIAFHARCASQNVGVDGAAAAAFAFFEDVKDDVPNSAAIDIWCAFLFGEGPGSEEARGRAFKAAFAATASSGVTRSVPERSE